MSANNSAGDTAATTGAASEGPPAVVDTERRPQKMARTEPTTDCAPPASMAESSTNGDPPAIIPTTADGYPLSISTATTTDRNPQAAMADPSTTNEDPTIMAITASEGPPVTMTDPSTLMGGKGVSDHSSDEEDDLDDRDPGDLYVREQDMYLFERHRDYSFNFRSKRRYYRRKTKLVLLLLKEREGELCTMLPILDRCEAAVLPALQEVLYKELSDVYDDVSVADLYEKVRPYLLMRNKEEVLHALKQQPLCALFIPEKLQDDMDIITAVDILALLGPLEEEDRGFLDTDPDYWHPPSIICKAYHRLPKALQRQYIVRECYERKKAEEVVIMREMPPEFDENDPATFSRIKSANRSKENATGLSSVRPFPALLDVAQADDNRSILLKACSFSTPVFLHLIERRHPLAMDRAFVSNVVWHNPSIYKWLQCTPSNLQSDKSICIAAVQNDFHQIKFVPTELCRDTTFIGLLYKRQPLAKLYEPGIEAALQLDNDLARLAVPAEWNRFANAKLRSDADVVLRYCTVGGAFDGDSVGDCENLLATMRVVSDTLTSDKQFCFSLVQKREESIAFVSHAMRSDPEIVLAAAEAAAARSDPDFSDLLSCNGSLWSEPTFATKMLRLGALVHKLYIPDELFQEPSVMLDLIRAQQSLRHVGLDLKSDPQFVVLALQSIDDRQARIAEWKRETGPGLDTLFIRASWALRDHKKTLGSESQFHLHTMECVQDRVKLIRQPVLEIFWLQNKIRHALSNEIWDDYIAVYLREENRKLRQTLVYADALDECGPLHVMFANMGYHWSEIPLPRHYD